MALIGTPPTNYTPQLGGIPGVTDPSTNQGNMIAGNLANWAALQEFLKGVNTSQNAQALANLYANMPGAEANRNQLGTVIGQQLQGKIPADVVRQLTQRGAERGVTIGAPESANTNAALMRAFYDTSTNQIQRGAGNLSQLTHDTPTVAPLDPSRYLIDLPTQTSSQTAADLYAAAPDPWANYQFLKSEAGIGNNLPPGATLPVGGLPNLSGPPTTTHGNYTGTIGPGAYSMGGGTASTGSPFDYVPRTNAYGNMTVPGPFTGAGSNPFTGVSDVVNQLGNPNSPMGGVGGYTLPGYGSAITPSWQQQQNQNYGGGWQSQFINDPAFTPNGTNFGQPPLSPPDYGGAGAGMMNDWLFGGQNVIGGGQNYDTGQHLWTDQELEDMWMTPDTQDPYLWTDDEIWGDDGGYSAPDSGWTMDFWG